MNAPASRPGTNRRCWLHAATRIAPPAFAIAVAFTLAAADSDPGRPRVGERRGGPEQGVYHTNVPAHRVDMILARPTRTSVTLSVLAYEDFDGVVAHGNAPGTASQETPRRRFRKGEPVEIVLDGLQPASRYFYELRSVTDAGRGMTLGEGTLVTARPPGDAFTFTVQADSHLDGGIEAEIYLKSLTNALAARPDFHIDLGDTFMTDKYPDYRQAASQYLAQRYYLGIIGARAPVFLVLGNHDGETPGEGRREEMAVWANSMRKTYFPNPLPGDFFTGNPTPHPRAGPLQNYYAWSWGDALFVVLDPYWYSTAQRRGRGDNWSRTLGAEQYRWLTATLAGSRARFRFVFIHHLVGGETPEGRGGAEASHFFEWGGKELDGRDTFAQKRPGWPLPIHDLLVKHRVNVVFHGHDHLYAQQERDGIVYQLVPQPGHARFDNTRSAAEYGYKSGVIAGASGILRVAVSPQTAVVEYVRAYPANAENGGRWTGSVTHRFTVAPSGQ